MKKHLIVLTAALSVVAVAPAATASADAGNESIACTLEKKGILHSPTHSFCYPHNP
jgi:hypothetical protein